MSKSKLENLSAQMSVFLALGVASLLTGCVAQDIALDDSYTPYTVEERYPLNLHNGRIVRKQCGQWTEDLSKTADNSHFRNHGCATRANMAAMIANPNDLVVPRRRTQSVAANQVEAVAAIKNARTTNSSTRSPFSIF